VLGGQRHHERAVHVARHHHVGLETGPLAACARLKSKAVTLGTSSQPHRRYTTLLQSRLMLTPRGLAKGWFGSAYDGVRLTWAHYPSTVRVRVRQPLLSPQRGWLG
jgi:hypothetical protein